MGHDLSTDPGYLAYQYGDAARLRIRQEAHRRYSERPDDFLEWVVDHLDPQPGERIGDVGCGPGIYHPLVAARGAQVVALDPSWGMVAEVARQGGWVVQGDAQQLPWAHEAFHRVMANHMLYHVPDRRAALQEMWRVLRPGGRVVLATNAGDHLRRLHELHAQVARSLGYRPLEGSVTERFSLDHLALVRSVFPNARVHVRPDAFRFPTVEAALAYYASMAVDRIADPPGDGSHRPRLLAAMAEVLQEVWARDGVIRVEKTAGCFVAEKTVSG